MDGDPLLRVVRGTPTAEELAALVGVLCSTAPAPVVDPPTPSRWLLRARFSGSGLRPGPGAWRASALPR
jgi:hypothetical protein